MSKKELGGSFLNEKLIHAIAYDRIAGYFSPSILQIAGERLEAIPKIRMICNSQIHLDNIKAGNSISETAFKDSLWREWCGEDIENKNVPGNLLEKLYRLLDKKQLEVRILPDEYFGLIHGKAGVVTYRDGRKTSFMGSANETLRGWKLNYELIWEDESNEAIQWVQDEFDALWGHEGAIPLTRSIIDDILRNAERKIQSRNEWIKNAEPASPIVESPVYRKHNGLWAHQKYFVHKAFEDHKNRGGARYILADQVGLGKTLQLAMTAQLMALYGEKPILIIVPKTLIYQWQGELVNLLDVPSAVWTGQTWVDENGVEQSTRGQKAIQDCPRKIGIISQGLIQRGGEIVDYLLKGSYECVIVDEAHRARRRNIPAAGDLDVKKPLEYNNLYHFILKVSEKTKSMLLATATPVQLHPVEAWDLLYAMQGRNSIPLGDAYSNWNRPDEALKAVLEESQNLTQEEFWQWLRNPFPPSNEYTRGNEMDFKILRDSLDLKDHQWVSPLQKLQDLQPSDLARIDDLKDNYFKDHNPFIRHIIRRTREYLEKEIDPETKQPLLPEIKVKLFGEDDDSSLTLGTYQEKAYQLTKDYCKLLKNRKKGSGFLETLLLRRIGSSMIAGLKTSKKLLHGEVEDDTGDISIDDFKQEGPSLGSEGEILQSIINILEDKYDEDPKYNQVYELLNKGCVIDGKETEPWLDRGCIIFTGYFDTANWIAKKLSENIPGELIGLYAGSGKSLLYQDGHGISSKNEKIKKMVTDGQIKLVVGTDAASEGLNFQMLASLINIDLPWNPTRLEQRKGRIQRIGQKYSEVYIYNMRYKDSVEDNVHKALSLRLKAIGDMFGQIPDTLEDVWIDIAFDEIEKAENSIRNFPEKHPFDVKYQKVARIDGLEWEKCSHVLNDLERKEVLSKGWR